MWSARAIVFTADRLEAICAHAAGRVRRARARLFGPGHDGVSVAEATLRLRDGSTVSETAEGTTTRDAINVLAARLARRLPAPEHL